MKAMILAAGMGSRLRPLTDHTPKPLVKIRGRALIEHHLLALQSIGVVDIIINVSYHAKQLMEFLGDGEKYGVKITYSYEENGPYGTGGGIFHALPLLGDAPFLVISADIYTDFLFEKLMTEPVKKAHLVMVANPAWHLHGDYGLLNGIVNFEEPKFTYASFGLFSPSLFLNCVGGTYGLFSPSLIDVAIQEGQVTGELYSGSWHNIGTLEDLHLAEGVIR
jgi:MurNAc alpha-1-phosphate uridylyltransferase